MRCLHQVQLTTFKPSFKSKDFVFALAKTLKPTTDQTLKPTTTIANQTREERESGLERERESKIKTKRGIGSLNKERR